MLTFVSPFIDAMIIIPIEALIVILSLINSKTAVKT